MILSERASQEYLEYLRSKHISYITTGRDSIDLPQAMETLRTVFGVERLAVVGGGHINGSMLDQGLIDEVSMMYGYGIDGRGGMAAAFDGRPMDSKPVRLTFKSVEELDGIVWMRYQVK
jgi:riboflavin biosynthesis pyrimidine reductase